MVLWYMNLSTYKYEQLIFIEGYQRLILSEL